MHTGADPPPSMALELWLDDPFPDYDIEPACRELAEPACRELAEPACRELAEPACRELVEPACRELVEPVMMYANG